MADISTIIHNILEQLTYTPGEPMLFSSGVFWALFIVFIPVFAMLRDRLWQMVSYVVAFSLFFYYKSSGFFVFLLVATSLIDWTMSRVLVRVQSRLRRRLCVVLSVTTSLAILCYFKYANFFMWNWQQMVGGNFEPMDIILPVGISFYTFQSISYIVDVYKGRVAPTKTWLEYAFFLSFFPALVAGPIVRADYFLPQIRNSRHATRPMIYLGLWLIILGVVKKAIIADYIAQYNDLIFSVDATTGVPGYSGFECLMGIIGYTMQIYCDFSGYSDMAIGIALIIRTSRVILPIFGGVGIYRFLRGCAIMCIYHLEATARGHVGHTSIIWPRCLSVDCGMARLGNSCSGEVCMVPAWRYIRRVVLSSERSETIGASKRFRGF